MYFEISRAYVAGQPMTVAQRTSSLFSEEPTVLGKALRRGLPPLKIDEKQFAQAEHMLRRLFDAGAINIKAVDGEKVVDFREEGAKAKIAAAMPAASDELSEMTDPLRDPEEEKKAIIQQHEADRKVEVAAGDRQPQTQEGQTAFAPPANAPEPFADKTEVVPVLPPPPEVKKPLHKDVSKKGRKD